MSWLNSLAWWQWGLLGIVPPLIISLYFLKLKRQPLEVPSTYLWSRTIEDLHVNSIWQKLRQSLLLLLQLLAILLLVFALLRPGWKGTELAGERLIFLIDNSASMTTKDINGRSRLDEAKRRALAMVEEMNGEVAMVVTFSDDANAVQTFTDNRRMLQRKIRDIKPTNRRTDPLLALRYAAGLANPGRQANRPEDANVAEARPATLYIMSDGGFPVIRDFSLGNLNPEFISLGDPSPHNVGIVSFAAARNPEDPTQLQAFARLENGGATSAEVLVTLRFEGEVLDSQRQSIPASDSFEILQAATDDDGNIPRANIDAELVEQFERLDVNRDEKLSPDELQSLFTRVTGGGATFNLPADLEPGVLTVELENPDGSGPYEDQMTIDNIAYAPVNPPRRARVLLVSHGSQAWEMALSTERIQQIADISLAKPSVLESEAFVEQTSTGAYDLVIFDMCSPKEMPLCNTLFLGTLPPGEDWTGEPFERPPFLLDSNRTHPLMQMVDMTGLLVLEGIKVVPPKGGQTLMEADLGSLLSIAPRRAYEDAVLSFGFTTYKDGVADELITNWPRRTSFPVFVMNVVKYLGGSRGSLMIKAVKPGKELRLNSLAPVDQLRVETPLGNEIELFRESAGAFVFSNTSRQGVYSVYEGEEATEPSQRFSVNLFDRRETNVIPVPHVMIEEDVVTRSTAKQQVRKELWKWILLLLLGLLTFEWYVYNRRVYM